MPHNAFVSDVGRLQKTQLSCQLVGNETDLEGLKAKNHVRNFPWIYLKQRSMKPLFFDSYKYACAVFICSHLHTRHLNSLYGKKKSAKTWCEHGIVSLIGGAACDALWVAGCSLAAAGNWLFCPVFRCRRSLLSHINYRIKTTLILQPLKH